VTGGILATIATPIRVTFPWDGEALEVFTERLMADQWLEALLKDELTWGGVLVQVLPDQGMENVVAALLAGSLPAETVTSAGQSLLTVAAGRDWWEVINILAVADETWEALGGELALAGITPERVTLGVWLDAVWLLLRRLWSKHGESELNQLVTEVKRKPVAGDADPEVDGAMDAADFMAAAGELRGRLPG